MRLLQHKEVYWNFSHVNVLAVELLLCVPTWLDLELYSVRPILDFRFILLNNKKLKSVTVSDTISEKSTQLSELVNGTPKRYVVAPMAYYTFFYRQLDFSSEPGVAN